VASVNPQVLLRFVTWSYNHGGTVVIDDYRLLPIQVNVPEPEKVGLEPTARRDPPRNRWCPPGTPAITVDVGTAVTVNLVDAEGVFQGGAIFPGPTAHGSGALHDHTARLPLAEPTVASLAGLQRTPSRPIQTGILGALGGGFTTLTSLFADECSVPPWLFLTGGGHHLIDGYVLPWAAQIKAVPTLTLEGIRIAAEALP